MLSSETTWSEVEQKIAKEAFNRAYDQEISSLIEEVKLRVNSIGDLEDLWQIHDFLSAKRHQIDGKYDDRPSSLIFVFAQLVKENLIALNELEGLEKDKLAKIAALSKM